MDTVYQDTQDIYLKAFWICIDRARNRAGVTWTYLQGGDTPRAINGTANPSIKKTLQLMDKLDLDIVDFQLDVAETYERLLEGGLY
ncbi:hypothetical protein LMOIWNZ_00057 [Enterococcus phage vB_OCPT_CCS3]|nr:hypothetical protein LMOIWNZ_00057 [Enterococcus phage vB_OCPT_CCS3]